GGTAPAPHSHPPQRAEDGKAQGSEQQDWKKGVQHGGAPKDRRVLQAKLPGCLARFLVGARLAREGDGSADITVERQDAFAGKPRSYKGYPQALRNPCTTAARRRWRRVYCAAPRSRRCGTASSRRPPGSAKVAA